MSSLSLYISESILNHFFRNVPTSGPTQIYLALFSTSPTSQDIGDEVTGNGYARQPLVFKPPVNKTTVVGPDTVYTKITTNEFDVTFGPALESWGLITHAAIYTDIVGGNLMAQAPLNVSTTVSEGYSVIFREDKITFEFK
jgi:hypothetical protein